MIGSIWFWMTSSPLLFITYLRVPLHSYGYYGFSGIAVYILTAFINSKVVGRFTLEYLLGVGLFLCFSSSMALIISGHFGCKDPLFLQAIELIFAAGLAFIIPNSSALALSTVTQSIGICSALLGALEMGIGSLFIFGGSEFFNGTIISIAAVKLVGTLLSIGFYVILLKNTSEAENEPPKICAT